MKLDDRVEFPLLLDIAPFLEAEAGGAAGGAKAGKFGAVQCSLERFRTVCRWSELL